jgi:hypothetical protein
VVINDLDGEVAHFFHTLRTRGDQLARACQLTPYSRAEYEACAQRPADLDPVERARRWWVRCYQGFNKAGAAGRAGWLSSTAPKSNPAPDFATRADELLAAAARLRTVLIENRPAVEVIAKYGANHTTTRARHATEVLWCNRPLDTHPDLFTAPARDETSARGLETEPSDETPLIEAAPVCAVCGTAVASPATSRPRAYCSRACQQRAYRTRRAIAPTPHSTDR